MPRQDEFAQRRLLQQQLMARALMSGSDFKEGDPPAKAWQPVVQQFGAAMAGHRLNREQKSEEEKRSNALANVLSAFKGTPDTPATPDRPYTEQDVGSGVGPLNIGQPVPGTGTPAIPGKRGSRDSVIESLIASGQPDFQKAGLAGMMEKPQRQWETVEGPRGATLQRDPVTGELKQIIGPEREKDWQNPAYIEAMQKIYAAKNTAKPEKVTDTERMAAGYATRMEEAENLMGKTKSGQKPGVLESMGATVPFAGKLLSNVARPPERQQYRQAQEDWVRSKLRKESGAVIADEEMDREIRVYFPQLGDSPEVIDQKTNARQVSMDAMRQAAGPAWDLKTRPPKNTQPQNKPTGGLTAEEQTELEQLRKELNRGR